MMVTKAAKFNDVLRNFQNRLPAKNQSSIAKGIPKCDLLLSQELFDQLRTFPNFYASASPHSSHQNPLLIALPLLANWKEWRLQSMSKLRRMTGELLYGHRDIARFLRPHYFEQLKSSVLDYRVFGDNSVEAKRHCGKRRLALYYGRRWTAEP